MPFLALSNLSNRLTNPAESRGFRFFGVKSVNWFAISAPDFHICRSCKALGFADCINSSRFVVLFIWANSSAVLLQELYQPSKMADAIQPSHWAGVKLSTKPPTSATPSFAARRYANAKSGNAWSFFTPPICRIPPAPNNH